MRFAGVVAMMLATVQAGAVAADSIEGRWITESGNLEVAIARCVTEPDALCGTVVRVIANRSMGGSGKEMQPVDSRPALGMTILSSLTSDSEDPPRWVGDLYNRENGKTYRCVLSLDAPDRLNVRGYVGLPVFGKTQIWQRATATTATSAGPAAPDFTGIDQWLNSPPLTIPQLRGNVVLVDFWTYMCGNCLNTLPYVKQWHERYAADGLIVVGVHTPELPAERDPKNVEKAVARYGIAYPVALDPEYATWRAYKNRYWPALYLIDRQGHVVYRHIGEGDYAETEARIRALLADAAPNSTPH